MNEAFSIIKSILLRYGGTFEIADGLLVLAAIIVTFGLDIAEIKFGPKLKRGNSFTKGLVLGALLVIIFTLKSSSIIPFIYFEF